MALELEQVAVGVVAELRNVEGRGVRPAPLLTAAEVGAQETPHPVVVVDVLVMLERGRRMVLTVFRLGDLPVHCCQSTSPYALDPPSASFRITPRRSPITSLSTSPFLLQCSATDSPIDAKQGRSKQEHPNAFQDL